MIVKITDEKYVASPHVLKEQHYLSINLNKARLDTILLKKYKGILYLNKITHYGNLVSNNYISLNDFIFNEFILEDKSFDKTIYSSVNGGKFLNGSAEYPTNYIDPSGLSIPKNNQNNKRSLSIQPTIFLNNINDFIVYDRNISLKDNSDFVEIDINSFEDLFNMDYYDTLSNILIPLLMFNLEIPFKMDIKIDNTYGIQVENIISSTTTNSINDILKNKIKHYMEFLHKRFWIFKDNCDNEKRHLGIYVHIDYFDTIIHINDYIYKMTHFIHLNNSDHFRLLKILKYIENKEDDLFYEAAKYKLVTPFQVDFLNTREEISNFCNNINYNYLDNIEGENKCLLTMKQ